VAVSTLAAALEKFEEEGEEVSWTNIPHRHTTSEEEILEKVQKLQQLQELKARLQTKMMESQRDRAKFMNLIELYAFLLFFLFD